MCNVIKLCSCAFHLYTSYHGLDFPPVWLIPKRLINNDDCRSVNKVHEEWFADEERVRKSVGLLEKPIVPLSRVTEVRSLLCYWKLIHFVAIITFICAAVSFWDLNLFTLFINQDILLAGSVWDLLWELPSWWHNVCWVWSSFLYYLLERFVSSWIFWPFIESFALLWAWKQCLIWYSPTFIIQYLFSVY